MKNLSFRQSSKMKIYATSQVERLLAAYDKEARNGKEMIALNMGIPFYGMLPEIKNNLKNSLADIKNDFYSPFPGKYELRTKLAEISSEKTGSLVTADEIIITAGASSGIFNILLAILNPNEEVIVPAPYFYTYRHQVELVGGQAREVYLTLDQNNHWEIPIETVKKTINSKTRAIIINSPNNPTGAIFSEKNLRELASLVEQKEIYIICDEVYDYLIYDNQSCFNLATIKELKPYIFRCGSFSKIYGMTGWRVGYIQAAPELITVLTGINMDTVTCPPTIAQEAVIIGLTSKLDSLSEYIKQLIKNRKILIENLDKMGDWFSYIPPQGAYYCWVKYNSEKLAKKTGINKWTSYDLAMQLTKEAQVGLFPGTCFGIGGEGYLRITFGGDSEKLIQGLDRIKNWFENKLTP